MGSPENEVEAGAEGELAAEESCAESLGAHTDREAASESYNLAEADSPGAVAEYMRVQFHPLMDIITGPDGPFWAYDEALNKRHSPGNWTTEKAPEGMFRDRNYPEENL